MLYFNDTHNFVYKKMAAGVGFEPTSDSSIITDYLEDSSIKPLWQPAIFINGDETIISVFFYTL